MIKTGNKFIKNNIEYTINSIEPSKILEIISEDNPIMVKYSVKYKWYPVDTVVHVVTLEEYNSIISILRCNWFDKDYYNRYRESTCVSIKDKHYCSLSYYLDNGYKVNSYDEFLLNHSATITLEKFKSLFDGI